MKGKVRRRKVIDLLFHFLPLMFFGLNLLTRMKKKKRKGKQELRGNEIRDCRLMPFTVSLFFW